MAYTQSVALTFILYTKFSENAGKLGVYGVKLIQFDKSDTIRVTRDLILTCKEKLENDLNLEMIQ